MRVELSGIDGRNLLPYLAAVGVQYALTHQASTEVKRQPVRMNWDTGTFRPTLEFPVTHEEQTSGKKSSEDLFIHKLLHGLSALTGLEMLPADWKNIKGVSRQQLRENALEPVARAARSKGTRVSADFMVGLASDAGGTQKEIAYTALCAITGDSNQNFIGFMHDLRKQVTTNQLRNALFSPWRYEDEGRSFRWDSIEDRRYALRASDPSKGRDKAIPSMWGANRLAFEALACLPCFPRRHRVRTTAFEDERIIRWPLWSPPIDLATLRSLLAHPAIIDFDARTLRSMGVFAVASSHRVSVGRKRTFGPASIRPV